MKLSVYPFFVVLFLMAACSLAIKEDDQLLSHLMEREKEQFNLILNHPDSLEVQIIYTQINRDSNNKPVFKSFYFNLDSTNYFYPASTVKLPLVLLALEKLNNLNIEGLNKYTTMLTDSAYSGQVPVLSDSTSESGLPSVGHYAKKILVVSDNDAYNRLYEFLGQRPPHETLKQKGYNLRILHRLERALTPDENRHTEPIRFMNAGRLVYEQPMLVNNDSIKPVRIVKKGKGFIKNDSLIHQPFDFTYKNAYPLQEQQEILKAILFPEAIEQTKRFNLSEEDRKFVMKYMSQIPRETRFPPYAQDTSLHDGYAKFLMFAGTKEVIPKNIRIFNKVGDAYGYMIDNAYIVDFENQIEFILSAVINTNTDGIYNDGEYDYEKIGKPFMRNLGKLIYDYEGKRKRVHKPDLSEFILEYDGH